MLNDKLRSRLDNWKFRQAMQYIDGTDETEAMVIKALADMFEDCGQFSGTMSVLVESVVAYLFKGED